MSRIDTDLWELWEGSDDNSAILQTKCDAGCDKGLLLTPARFCPHCGGSGFKNRTIYFQKCSHKDCFRCEDEEDE